jgi:hypothetical protein
LIRAGIEPHEIKTKGVIFYQLSAWPFKGYFQPRIL